MTALAPEADDTAIDFTHQISEKLGTPFTSGSFGKVYQCIIETTKGNVEVAVKVFVSDPSKAVEEFENRIRRELKVWLRLKHPTIVPLLGIAYIDPPLPALVSRWMSSGTLRVYLKEATTITPSAKVGLVKGIADGLNYLHSENVIHGDLHPENVLIDGSGNPCLTDFGLATVEGEAELQLNTTTVERSFNSRWRAPEVIGFERGPERPHFKSDIYSFGGVIFFIYSGDMPWKGKNSVQIYIALWTERIHARPDDILDDQWNLIQQCWSWKPDNRPSAAEILASIDQSRNDSDNPPSEPDSHSEAVMRSTLSNKRYSTAPTTIRVRLSTFVPGWAISPRVLIVEDDPVSIRLNSKFLQVFGCIIDVAVNGVEAVNKMNLETYDLVLMDIVMPKMDGLSATELIRQFDHMTPIICVTACSKPREIMTYYSSGMNDVLPKPFTAEGLLNILDKHLVHLKVVQ